MANFRYFSDYGKEPEVLTHIRGLDNAAYHRLFPGVRGFRSDSFQMLVGTTEYGVTRPVTRKIEYKSAPSLHECNARCLNGKCTGVCECRCGGKNHGRGSVAAREAQEC